jgi:hypothetical protein
MWGTGRPVGHAADIGAPGRSVTGAMSIGCYTVVAMATRSWTIGVVGLSLLLLAAGIGGVAAFIVRAGERVPVVQAPVGTPTLTPKQVAYLESIVDPSKIPPLPSFQCPGGQAMCAERAGELPEDFWRSPAPLRRPFPSSLPAAWSVHDDAGFRYTFAVPADWYVRFADSGGYANIFNPSAVRSYAGPDQLSTIELTLQAHAADSDAAGPYRDAVAEPALTIAGGPAGVIEDRGLDEGVVKSSEYVFEREGAVFVIEVRYGAPVRPEDQETVSLMLESITPY